MLSQASRSVGFAIRPAHEAAVFDRVEFVPLERHARARRHRRARRPRDSEGDRLAEPLDADDLRQAANYLNDEFSGCRCIAPAKPCSSGSRRALLYDALRARALRLATSTFSDLPDDRPMYVEGASSLLDDATG
jgi:transcriptional regulator of heat shock response